MNRPTSATLLLAILLASMAAAGAPPEVRAVYLSTAITNSQEKADTIIDEVLASSINQVFLQVRARGDAYYYPNREDATYPNPEPRAQRFTLEPADLDLLQHYIDRLHTADPPREVHAWLTVYNTWNVERPPDDPSHVFLAHSDWITRMRDGEVTTSNNSPLDPGIPEVQDYLFNVFMDIVRNYDVDGIHFDYIRLEDSDSGFHPEAKAAFLAQTGWNYDRDGGEEILEAAYNAWRRDQASKLVQRIHQQTMLEKPWVETSAFIISFTDSVTNLAQGYNWWVAHGAIDSLHPSSYSASVEVAVARYENKLARLAQNGDEHTRRLVPAMGSYLFARDNPQGNRDAVIALRGHARKPDGFNFFTHNSLHRANTEPPDQLARDLFGPGGPMAEWAPVPPLAHKVREMGQEFVAPNPPAAVEATLVSGSPRVAFQRPAPAADGDMPVHYRLYRDTQNPPRRHYSNMVMEWWDADSGRENFVFHDVEAPSGSPIYYAVVALDDWNNAAITQAGPVTPTARSHSTQGREPKPAVIPHISTVTEIIVDSEPTELDYDDDGREGRWTRAEGEGYHGGSARLYPAENFPFASVAIWIVDLPRAGRWAIDGWAPANEDLADTAMYRFVDADGVVQHVIASQRAAAPGWSINVDGVSDSGAHAFPAGHVYVTIHGNESGARPLVADALRFRYMGD